jgi:hypothetical protein
MIPTHKEINNRLRAGAIVVLVEDPDEALALESAKVAAKQFQPVTVRGAADADVVELLEKHKNPEVEGTLILCDFLRANGGNPIAVRMIREVALQKRADKKPFSRLILIEVPGTNVPESLRGDIEYLIPAMPDVKELRVELDEFVNGQDITLPGNGENRHAIASSVAGLSRHEAMRLFSRCWVDKQALDSVWLRKEKATRVSERLGGALTFVDTGDLPTVGGMSTLRGWLSQRRNAFGSERAKEFGLPEPKGVILVGPPGTGKSLTPKSIGQEWGLPLLRLDAGKLFGSLVGQSEAQTRLAIEAAEACAPCILWIDEMEKGFGNNGGLDGGTSARVFGTFLTWLQEKVKPVFVVATCNDVAGLPPELLRKGRFDEIFYVDLPSLSERNEIAKIHLERRKRSKVNSNLIATATEGFSGSEIEQAIIEGMFAAFSKERDVTASDILQAIKRTVPLSKTMAEKLKVLRSWADGRAQFASRTESQEIGDEPKARRSGVSQ